MASFLLPKVSRAIGLATGWTTCQSPVALFSRDVVILSSIEVTMHAHIFHKAAAAVVVRDQRLQVCAAPSEFRWRFILCFPSRLAPPLSSHQVFFATPA